MTDSSLSPAITVLRTRAARVISGTADDCYDSEFVRAIALVIEEEGGRAEVLGLQQRLQDKYRARFSVRRLTLLVNDELARLHREAEAAKPEKALQPWEFGLIHKTNKDGTSGEPLLCEHNALLFFEGHPDWQNCGGGVVGYNEFTASHAILAPPPYPVQVKTGETLKDHHDTEFARWLQLETGQAWHVDMVRRAVDCYARQHVFHPVRDYLRGLPEWDRTERLPTFLTKYCGAGKAEGDDAEPDELDSFISAIGERWAISAVARVFRPGCQADHVLILEGGEGLGKSTAVRLLAGEKWAGTMSVSLEGKPAQELISSGVWIWELAEMASLKRTAQIEQVKDFVTRRREIFRPAYGRRVVEYDRQCVFVATVNGDDYLDRSDGKRRWWPVRCVRPFDLEGLAEVVPLLWAEAVWKFDHGHIWHFDPAADAKLIDTAKKEQASRVPEEVLQTVVETAAIDCAALASGDLCGTASVAEILAYMKIPEVQRRSLQQDVGRCLVAAGWKMTRPRIADGVQVRRYRDFERYPQIKEPCPA